MKANVPQHLHLVTNAKSGRGEGGKIAEEVQRACDKAKIQLSVYSGRTPEQFEKEIQRAVKSASEDGGAVVAAGGDGTVRSVAQHIAGTHVPMAIIPIGTFNFFARAHHIPEDIGAAIQLALTAAPVAVQLGEVNGKIFIINASLGLYAKSIREREERTKKFGRHRLTAVLSTATSLLRSKRLLNVEMVVDGRRKEVLTPSIFIGNNALQLGLLNFSVAGCIHDGSLAVILMRPVTKMEMLRILFRGLTKTVENEENLETFCGSSLVVNPHKQSQEVALDGEIFHMEAPLQISVAPHVLQLIRPPK